MSSKLVEINRRTQLGKRLGKDHKRKISNAMKQLIASGKHNFWKSGITNKNILIRSSMEYSF